MTDDPEVQNRLRVLEEENATLIEQVKFFVRTEHQLRRSQLQVDRQASRLRSLAAFAVRCGALRDTVEILRSGCTFLDQTFRFDGIVALCVARGKARRITQEVEERVDLSPSLEAWLLAQESALVISAAGGVDETVPALLELRRALPGFPRAGSPAVAVIIPIRCGRNDRRQFVVGWNMLGVSSFHVESPKAEHSPLFQLVGSHLERAVQNALLVADLTERSGELERSNAMLRSTMSEIERAQELLVQRGRLEAIGQLAGGVAHDFNNLLAVILAHVEFAQKSSAIDEQTKDDLHQVEHAARRAAEITAKLLAFGKNRSDDREPHDLHVLMGEEIRMLRRLLGSQYELALELTATDSHVMLDAPEFTQAVMNLVVNARDAMPDGGRIVIRTRAATDEETGGASVGCDWIALEVMDTGVGMDDATRLRMFEPFFSTKAASGTGLGLAVVYGTIEAAGGKVLVHSEVNRGTTFTLLVPLEVAPVSRTPLVESVLPQGRARILVVDDEPAVCRAASRILRSHGYHVREASGGEEALSLLQREPFDLVLSDVMMPGMDGPALAMAARAQGSSPPFLFASGYAGAALRGQRALAKPYSAAQLLKGVQEALSVGNAPGVREAHLSILPGRESHRPPPRESVLPG